MLALYAYKISTHFRRAVENCAIVGFTNGFALVRLGGITIGTPSVFRIGPCSGAIEAAGGSRNALESRLEHCPSWSGATLVGSQRSEGSEVGM